MNDVTDIVGKWEDFTEGHDEDDKCDRSIEFFNGLSRGELARLMDYVEDKGGK